MIYFFPKQRNDMRNQVKMTENNFHVIKLSQNYFSVLVRLIILTA